MNRALYLLMWAVEILLIIGLVSALILPIQDYAMPEFFEWQQHPSPETYKAFLEKQRQEKAARLIFAAPFAVTAVLLSGPLRKHRRKSRWMQNRVAQMPMPPVSRPPIRTCHENVTRSAVQRGNLRLKDE